MAEKMLLRLAFNHSNKFLRDKKKILNSKFKQNSYKHKQIKLWNILFFTVDADACEQFNGAPASG